MAAEFFGRQLQLPSGSAARCYLADRNMSASMQSRFGIGYAPADRFALKSFLAEKNIRTEAMIEAGLVIGGEDIAVPYDRFRDRIMFPIRDIRGRAIAFGGRALRADVPAKYLNSPETPIFSKSQVLYNLNQARKSIHQNAMIIAVEGYMDVIALARAGFDNAVAPLGTALTEQQLHLMWRQAPEPILCFDGDSAGIKAAFRAMDMALAHLKPGYSLRFALLPEGMDPDDIVTNNGPQALQDILDKTLSLSELLWRRALEENDRSTPERRARFEVMLEEATGRIGDDKVRMFYKTEMRQRQRQLWQQGRTVSRKYSANRPYRKNRGRQYDRNWDNRQPPSRELMAQARTGNNPGSFIHREKLIILAFVNHPELLDQLDETLSDLVLHSRELDRLRREILNIASLGEPLEKEDLKSHLLEKGFTRTIDEMNEQARKLNSWFFQPDAAPDDALTGLQHMLALHHKSITLERELKEAERNLAESPTEENFYRLNEIREMLSSTQGEEASIEGFGEASGRTSLQGG